METPLLNGFSGEHQLKAFDGDYRPAKGWREWRSVFWIETVKVWKIGGPIVLTNLCQIGVNTVTSMFVGHIGDIELSAVSIAMTVINVFSFGFLLGMGSALETLCGQAFGAGQVHMLGIYVQRSWIILLVTCLLLLPIYLFATPVLKLLGQEADIADVAGTFSIKIIPQMFSLAINFPIQKLLQAQSKVNVVMWIAVVALIAHVGLLWLFIIEFGWGLNGAAAAFDITSWATVVAQVIYVVNWCNEGWTGFSWAAFNELWAFVRLSVSSAFMLCLELWYFMSIIILSGHFQDAVIAVGSLSICMNINGIEAMFFIGSLLVGIISVIVVMAARKHIAIFFTNTEALQQAVAHLAYLLSLVLILNSVQPVISGVAIGGGWQGLVAYINLACYYVLGLPLGYLLGYPANLGVEGLWGGMIVGTALQTLILVFVLYRTNWNKEVEEITERMRKWGGQDIREEKRREDKPIMISLHKSN
ncbi:hypothetical protein RJ639_030099, partial [Escallonia herrerae]